MLDLAMTTTNDKEPLFANNSVVGRVSGERRIEHVEAVLEDFEQVTLLYHGGFFN
jgi:hypothetical protein